MLKASHVIWSKCHIRVSGVILRNIICGINIALSEGLGFCLYDQDFFFSVERAWYQKASDTFD